jgi:F-type H+-transporting ATPase subunit b
MLIDWFTVIAQAFNFLVLVWLLKRFLYKPILHAIDAREQRIAKVLAEAAKKESDAQKERDEFQRRNQEFTDEREALVRKMQDDISVKRQKLLDDAHIAADAISVRRQEVLQRDQHNLEAEIAQLAQDQVFAIARKTLLDLADAGLEERIANVFTRQLRELNGKEKQELAEALLKSAEPARVRSTFELPVQQRDTIQQALNETFAAEIPVRFEIASGGIGGLELLSNGRRIAWSINDYLSLLQKSIVALTGSKNATVTVDSDVESESVS